MLTILGCWAPFPAAGGATSAYLLENQDVKIMLDAGSGAVANLLKWGQPEKLDAVIISHWHEDHTADLPLLRYLMRGLFFTKKRTEKVKLFYPDSPEKPDLQKYEEFFDLIPLKEGLFFQLRGITGEAVLNSHPVLAYGFKFSFKKVFAFTGDTGYLKKHEEFYRGVDFLVAECTGFKKDAEYTQNGHLTTIECATLAKNAGAKNLIATHFWPFYEVDKLMAEVREVFPKALAAREGLVVV